MEDLELVELLDMPRPRCDESSGSVPSESADVSPVDAADQPQASLMTQPPPESARAGAAPRTTSTTGAKKDKTKSKGAAKRPRGGEKDLDTAAADSRAAFRHSQRLLRKTATSVDLKTALHRSFSHTNESQSQPPRDLHQTPVDTNDGSGCASAPQTPTSAALTPKPSAVAFSVHDITQRFLSKVHEKKQQTIKSLVHQRMVGHPSAIAGGSHASQQPSNSSVPFALDDDDAELVIDDASRGAQHKLAADSGNSSMMLNQRKQSVSSRITPMSSPLFSTMEDSRSSGSQASPTWDTIESNRYARTEGDGHMVAEDESTLASAIHRKHELLKFKKQQQHALRKDVDLVPPVPAGVDGPAVAVRQGTSLVATSARIAGGNAAAPAAPALLQQRSLVNTFHVSTTDISFLKRTNSFENSQSQSIVFRRD